MASKPIVLVTGATGFLGSHVVSQLLAQNIYTIRAAVRSPSKLRAMFPDASEDSLLVGEISDLTSDLSGVLRGVSAVIHTASPLYFKGESSKDIFEGVYQGTIQIVEQAIAAGIKKIIVTGTAVSLFDADLKTAFGSKLLTEKDFGSITSIDDIDLSNPNTPATYQAAKTCAEKKVWEIANQHPDVDVTVIIPPAIFGPNVPNFPAVSRASLSTNDCVYSLILNGQDTYPPVPFGQMVDVRDAARAHVAALSAPPIPGRDKRFLVSSGIFTWKGFADHLRKEKPELKDRLPREGLVQTLQQTNAPMDTEFTKEALGIKEYIKIEQTALEALNACMVLEKK
ncbi:NAD(P)-binding protein [Dendrothele bispora CBS 962.96]|uniref:NAD(P)-binding protein n=1 Tax=Dendrothele bispora (strain CBS 962.96) TaxID=1314807 RepID=A0A4S8LR01_DENBC|nr:NAD(P)-binding protein [Dendrothele bispora CBS 962.96]